MPLLLGKNRKINLKKPDEPAKWYVYAKTRGTIDEQEIARQVAEGTTLHAKEAEMAISQLKKVILRNIKEGYTVMLGDWGRLYPSVSSLPSDSAQEVTRRNVKHIRLNLRLNENVESELQKAKTIFIEDLIAKEKDKETKESSAL